jgi:hypothetical protein
MNLYEEFFRVVAAFTDRRIRYAVVGGLSLAFHVRPRFTRDIDLLVHPDDLSTVQRVLASVGYRPTAPAWTFKDSNLALHRFLKPDDDDEMVVDIIVADRHHIRMLTNAIQAESEAGPVPVARKHDLIRLKRARNSKQDQVDIESLRDDED